MKYLLAGLIAGSSIYLSAKDDAGPNIAPTAQVPYRGLEGYAWRCELKGAKLCRQNDTHHYLDGNVYKSDSLPQDSLSESATTPQERLFSP